MSGKGFGRSYPRGRISSDDEGQTQVAIVLDPKTKTIILRYQKPMDWVGLDEDAAMQLITVLAKHLSTLKGIPVSIVIGDEGDEDDRP